MRGRSDNAGERGMSMVELAVVVGIMAIVMIVAIPQLAGARRNMRAAAGPMEIKAQLRYARQLAMGRQRAVTFQYKTDDHEINVIEHNLDYAVPGGTTKAGTPVLNDASYPLTAGHTVPRTQSLLTGGVTADDLAYGLPPGAPSTPLDDTTTLTPAVNNQINITFQPDGSVIDASGSTRNVAMVFYHPSHPEGTTRAVTVLGASGRVKVWRYTDDQTFVE
jgi:Tfp pilus assembly protein FimT